MDTDVSIEPRALRELSRPRTAEASKLKDLAEAADRIAGEVEHRWSELSAEAREQLAALTYSLIEPSKGARRFPASLAGRMFLALVVLKGHTEALYEYLAAVRRLVNAVLTAIERQSAEYQSTLRAAVEEAAADATREERWLPRTSAAGSTMFRMRRSAEFERSLEGLLRARYGRDPRARRALLALVEKALAELAARGRLAGAHPEPWTAGALGKGRELWRYPFSMPGVRGAAGEGRLVYLLAPGDGKFVPAWLYTHAEFSRQPPDDALRALLAEATRARR